MKPLVSILIPAHNAEKTVADTIRSAMAQTWQPKEIIVVDDGSTDKTLEVARQFPSEGVRSWQCVTKVLRRLATAHYRSAMGTTSSTWTRMTC